MTDNNIDEHDDRTEDEDMMPSVSVLDGVAMLTVLVIIGALMTLAVTW